MIHIRKSAMLNYIYGNQMDTGETEVAAIVSAEGYEYNGACPPGLVLWLFVPSYRPPIIL